MSSDTPVSSYYPYDPSHVLPIVFAALIGSSLLIHAWQNFRYKSWKVMFFMVWGGTVFFSGWVMRCISTYHPANLSVYAAQSVLIICGPPIYSAAEYNILGRLLYYLPMHTPLHPGRIYWVFIYLGAAVEGLTAAGASQLSVAKGKESVVRTGGNLIVTGAVLQAVVECMFMASVGLLHYRCSRSKMLTPKVRNICIMLYGTSTLILLRCIFRTVEQVSTVKVLTSVCGESCTAVLRHEWFLYALEAAPMVLYTFWLNIMHPGRLLPNQSSNYYLDFDKKERAGPGWTDKRSQWQTFMDPFDLTGIMSGHPAHEKFWLRPDDWPLVVDSNYVEREAMDSSNSMKKINQDVPLLP